MTEHGRYVDIWRGGRADVLALFCIIAVSPPGLARHTPTPATFVVVESRFCSRDLDDAGEVRICLQNTGAASLSMAQLRVRIRATEPDSSDAMAVEQKCVYARLSPPVLQPGQYGQLVAKLFDRRADRCALTCTVSDTEGATLHTAPLAESALWISYVGFSRDLRKVFAYLENKSDEIIFAKSLRIGEAKADDSTEGVNRLVPPGDKGCLVCGLPTTLTPGEFVHVIASATNGDQEIHVHSVVRAIRSIPLLRESGPFDPDLGLDAKGFNETMTCAAHAHGPHEQAAGEFLDGYVQRFCQDPHQVTQLNVCRSNSPSAWFRFGSLPDVTRMNPVLSPPQSYDDENRQRWFNPFLYRGHLAKKATEPCRYVADLPIVPEESLFLHKELTPQEVKFLTYCAVASGAKGLQYRGRPAGEMLNRNAFVRLNKELRQIEPLLLIGEPVNWATAADTNYAAVSMLCGDRAIFVMVFDRRYLSRKRADKFYTPPFGRAVTPTRIDLKIPKEVSVGQVRSLFAPLERGAWVYRKGNLSFTADMIDSVQVYIADVEPRAKPSEERGLVP